MLSIAISSFFALAFLGSIIVIAAMFLQYRDRIVDVIQSELTGSTSETACQPTTYRHRAIKAPQHPARPRSPQSAPLRVAA